MEIEEIEKQLPGARRVVEVAVSERDDGFVVRPASVFAGPGWIIVWLNCTSYNLEAHVPAALGEIKAVQGAKHVEALWLKVADDAPTGSFRYHVHVTQARATCRGESGSEIIIKGR